MSESITASEARQILDSIQALTLQVQVNQAKTDEQFNSVRAEISAVKAELKAEINAVRAELKSEINPVRIELKAVDDKVNELRIQQRSTDARLWTFIVGLVTLVGGGVIKVLWFDRG